MQTLTFQNITLTPVKTDSQIWLTSADLANALGYAETDSVTKIYNRNKDEFTSNMTMTVKLTANGINGSTRQKETRIFSLRGCHLISMFARTKVAKEFRQWVLDILDKEVGQPVPPKTTTDDRRHLVQAVNALAHKHRLPHDEAYRMVHQYMGVGGIDEIALDDLPKAVAYVHHLTLGSSHDDTHAKNNAFWRTVGMIEYERLCEDLNAISSVIARAGQTLANLNRSRALIYDALAEQRIAHHGKYDRQAITDEAYAFIGRQTTRL